LSSISQNRLKGTVVRSFELPYALYLPPGYESGGDKRWPLLFFLHGAGERGDNLDLVSIYGPLMQVKEGRELPFIVVAPQCPENWTWDRSLEELDQLFLEIVRNYSVDLERIYVTGLSMGGYGTWHWAVHQPRAFAALVPICGGGMWLMGFPQRVAALKDVPIWTFHGDADEVVPLGNTAELVEELRKLGAPVKFTIYPGVGHDSWTPAYNEPELIPWLLAQRNTRFSFQGGEDLQAD
jgi:predicted peptidase